MKTLSITVPDQVAELLTTMSEESGQSLSGLGSQLLSQSAYTEASLRFKGINYLNAVKRIRAAREQADNNGSANNA